MVKKLNGKEFVTEFPMPNFDRVEPGKAIKDMSKVINAYAKMKNKNGKDTIILFHVGDGFNAYLDYSKVVSEITDESESPLHYGHGCPRRLFRWPRR